MTLRYILAVCFILVIENFAAEQNTYILYACDKDPKENGSCNPVTSEDYNRANGVTQFPLNEFPDLENATFDIFEFLSSRNVSTPLISYYKINIWGMVPFNKAECYPFSRSLIEPALHQALIDANETLCSDMSVETLKEKNVCYQITMNDTGCDAVNGLIEAMDVEEVRNLAEKCGGSSSSPIIMERDIFIGMSCDFVASRVSGIAANWDWPEVLPGVRSSMFDNKYGACYCETTTRTGHSATDLGLFTYQYYNMHGQLWNSSYILYTEGATLHGAPLHKDQLSDCTFLVAGVTTVFAANSIRYKLYENLPSDEYVIENAEAILRDLAGKTRVTFWCVGRKAMRVIMNTAARLGMTSGVDRNEAYTFTYLDLYNNNVSYSWSNEPDYPCQDDNITVGDSMAGMEALQVITLHRPQTEKFKSFSDNMMSKAQFSRHQQYVNHYVTQYYNSMRLVINGVTDVLERDPAVLSDGKAFTSQLWNRTFESIDGTVFIDELGNQRMNYAIMDLNTATNLFEEVAVFHGCNQTWQQLAEIDWPGSVRPSSAAPCDGSFVCTENMISSAAIAAIVLSILLLICLLVISFIARRKVLHEAKLREMRWKIKREDINFSRKNTRRMSGISEATYSTAGSDSTTSGIYGRQMFAPTAEWNHQIVAVKTLNTPKKPFLDRNLLVELNEMMSLNHEHICKFMGLCIDEPIVAIMEYCPRGSLQDFLEGEMYGKLDDMFRNSLILDIARGMLYLHKSAIHTHGNLKSANCLLDGRLVVKLTDFGLASFRQRHRRDSVIGYNHHKDLFWTAPELLRAEYNAPFEGTQKGDVYSFAIVAQEIVYRMGPFYLGEGDEGPLLNPSEICLRVQAVAGVPFRPTLQDDDYVVVGEQMRALLSKCWEEEPEERPFFPQIVDNMKKFTKKQNLIDRMIERLEQYSTNLEDKVEERTIQYRAEKERADNLLYQMLPKPVAEMLKSRREVVPCKYDCVTIYFSDIVGFTSISHKSNAFQVVTMLDSLYTAFDRVVDRFDVYKVETIGDAYMVTSGLPERNGNLHVREIARTALHLMEEARNFKIPHMPDEHLKIRVGIHSGPVVTGVVGQKMPRYCLFGDTVNTAARMEQSGEGMKIQLSPKAKSLLENFNTFVVTEREKSVQLKGLGSWKTWWLEKENVDLDDDSIATLKPTLESFNANNNLRESKKVSRTSDYGSARSSMIDPQRAVVTGIADDDGRIVKMAPVVNVEKMSDRSSSNESVSYRGVEHKKRRGTVILMEEAEITSLTSYYERHRERSFGYLPGISKVEFHDGYSSLNLPVTSNNKRRGRNSPGSSKLPAYNETDETSVF